VRSATVSRVWRWRCDRDDGGGPIVTLVHRAAISLQALLLLVIAAAVATLPAGATFKIVAAFGAGLPLMLLFPGLWSARRRACQWIAVWLVLYIGAAAVEVVAAAGGNGLAATGLLAALLELALVLLLIRRPTAPATHGRTES
jgi:uncharacterized membrane protein